MEMKFDTKPIPFITWASMAPPFKDHVYFQHGKHFPFQPEKQQFSPVNAWWLSEAALLAYAEEAFAAPWFRKAGFNHVHFFSGNSTQCYVVANDLLAIVAFRGTECGIDRGPDAIAQFIADLKVDIDIRMVDNQGGGKIHKGFNDGIDEVWTELEPCLKRLADSGRPLWLTGHSLGGPLAALTAARLKYAQGLYTFGAPRPGNKDFASRFPIRCFRIVNNNDMVPHLPLFPYAGLGELRYIDNEGDLHDRIDMWERWKDEIQGHIHCLAENLRNLDQGITATLPAGLKDHAPILYALHLWNHLIRSSSF